jgi:hypothetical protein
VSISVRLGGRDIVRSRSRVLSSIRICVKVNLGFGQWFTRAIVKVRYRLGLVFHPGLGLNIGLRLWLG